MNGRARLLVFDWDGTLSDSAGSIAGAIQAACRDMRLPVATDEQARYVIGMGLADALHHVAPGLDRTEHARFVDRFREHFMAADEAIGLFEGVIPLLEELDRLGFLLAIATGKSRRGLDRSLRRAGIASLFVATRCADEGEPKPHPGMLLHLMERTGSPATGTVMIGDTTHDLELARNAGVEAVAVTYGAHPREELVRHAPRALVDSVRALGEHLRSLVPSA